MFYQSVVTERRAHSTGKSQATFHSSPKWETHSLAERLRPYFAESLGTFALTLVAAGGEVIAHVSGAEVSHAARAIAPGLLVIALIYATGDASGAHFYPAVTFAFAARRDFSWTRTPGYWASQSVGALLAAYLLRFLCGTMADWGANRPQHGSETSFVMENLLTFLLVTIIWGRRPATA